MGVHRTISAATFSKLVMHTKDFADNKCWIHLLNDWTLLRSNFSLYFKLTPWYIWVPSFQTTAVKEAKESGQEGQSFCFALTAEADFSLQYLSQEEGSCDATLLNSPDGMWFLCSQKHHYSIHLHWFCSTYCTVPLQGTTVQQCKELLVIFRRNWKKLDDGACCTIYMFVQLRNAGQTELDETQSRPQWLDIPQCFMTSWKTSLSDFLKLDQIERKEKTLWLLADPNLILIRFSVS